MKTREIAIVVRNLILGMNLQSLSKLANPKEMVSVITECLFLSRCMESNEYIRQRQVWETLGGRPEVSIKIYGDAAKEWFRPAASYTADLVAMCMLCQIVDPKVVFEIGTFYGAGALHWAANATRADVYTLDLPPEAHPTLTTTTADEMHVGARAGRGHMFFENAPVAHRIHRLFGDSASYDFGSFAGKVDLFFIDGAHSYEYVRNDTEKALSCCHEGSVVAWHDYGRVGFNGVSRWLHEFASQGRDLYRIPGGSLAFMLVK
jgi:predicted O-methyltransferase YrrM